MCASAQFNRVSKADHPYLFPVFFSEQGHRAHLAGFFNGNVLLCILYNVFPDQFIDQTFRFFDFFRFKAGIM
jgi:hypothetical protein